MIQKTLLSALVILAGGGYAFAVQDTCPGMDIGMGDVSVPYDNTGSTPDFNATCNGANPNNNIWFTWTAAATGSTTVEVCGATHDVTVAAFADCTAGSELGCSDGFKTSAGGCAGGANDASFTFAATAGTTYNIQVGGWAVSPAGGFPSDGTGTLNITGPGVAGAGDVCTMPIPLACLDSQTIAIDTTAATPSGLNPGCGGTTNPSDVWYSITPANSGTMSLNSCDSAYDTRLAVWADDCATVLGCNDDNDTPCVNPQTDLVSALDVPVNGGTTYLIQVGGFTSATGTGLLNIELPCTGGPGNDDCAGAFPLAGCGGEIVTFDTTSATASGMNPGCGGVANRIDLWYSITAAATGTLTLDTCGSGFDTRLAVWDGCGGSVIACNDDDDSNCPGDPELISRVDVSVTAGTTYLVQVGGFTTATGGGILNVGALTPANDDCANCIPIAGCGDFPFDNNCATTDGPTSPLCDKFGTDQVSNDVWYSWTAPQTGNFTVSMCGGTTLDTKIAVQDGCMAPTGGPGTVIACNDDTCGLQSEVTFAATQGTDYKIRIGTFSALAFGSGTFNISTASGAQNYCTSNGGTMSVSGTSISGGVTISANNVPNSPGLFFFGSTQTSIVGGGVACAGDPVFGTLCVALPFLRLPPTTTASGNMNSLDLDFMGGSAQAITAGSCWNFQYWFRVPPPTSRQCDFTDGLSISFAP